MNMIDQPLKQSREVNDHQSTNHQDLNLVSQANENQEKLGNLPRKDASSSSGSSASNDIKFEDNNSKSANTYLPHLEIISNNSAAQAETTTLGVHRSQEN